METVAKLTGFRPSMRQNKRQRFAEIAYENSAIVDGLLKDAKTLFDQGQHAEAERLLSVARRILKNNKKYQDVVGDLLSNKG